MNDQLTRNEEDYLKAIDKLADDKGQVGTNALAKHLKLAAPSVTAMVQKLDGKGLVNYVKYGGISLTEIGQHKAIQLLRNHRDPLDQWTFRLCSFPLPRDRRLRKTTMAFSVKMVPYSCDNYRQRQDPPRRPLQTLRLFPQTQKRRSHHSGPQRRARRQR